MYVQTDTPRAFRAVLASAPRGTTLGDSNSGLIENATGIPTWGFKLAIALIGVGFLIRALEPAAHAVRRVATGSTRRNPRGRRRPHTRRARR